MQTCKTNPYRRISLRNAYTTILACVTSLQFGCSGKPRADIQAAFALMPRDVDLLYGFSLATAEANGVSANALVGLLPQQHQSFGQEILNETRSLCPGKNLAIHYVVGAQRHGEPSAHFVALNGSLDEGLLRQCFSAARPRIEVAEDLVRGTKVVSYRRGGFQFRGYWPEAHTLAFAVPTSMEHVVELASSSSHTTDNQELQTLRKRINPKAVVWALGRVPAGRKATGITTMPSPDFFVTNVTPEWNVEVVLAFRKDADAKTADEMLGRGLQPLMDRLDLGIAAADVKTRREGKELVLRLHVESSLIKRLVARGTEKSRPPRRSP